MGKAAGVKGDASATAVATHTTATYAGSWIAAPQPNESSYSKLTAGGVQVIYEVSWDFTYSGTDSAANGAAVVDSSTVTVTAGNTVLQSGNNKVLVNGDKNQDAHGNQVIIEASGKLTTA